MSQVFQLVRNSKLYHFNVYELILYSVPYLPISAFRSLLLEALLWVASLQKTLSNLLVPMLETLPGESITVARHFSCHWTVYPVKVSNLLPEKENSLLLQGCL